MTVSRMDVASAFALLDSVGCKRSGPMSSDAGLEAALTAWPVVLGNIDRAELLALTMAYVRSPSSAWFPTPGELLALRDEKGLDDALEQWGHLCKMLMGKGSKNPPTRHGAPHVVPLRLSQWHTLRQPPPAAWSLSDDAVEDAAMWAGVMALGGWRRACLMRDNDGIANRAAFRDAYRSALRRGARALEVDAVDMITAKAARRLLGGTS